MNQMPYIPFYVKDFTMDTSPLSPAACGAWIRTMCRLHTRDKRGTDTLPAEGWRRVFGADSTADVDAILDEWRVNEICNIEANVAGITITSRRMARERVKKEASDKSNEAKNLAEQERRARKKHGGLVAKLTACVPESVGMGMAMELKISGKTASLPPEPTTEEARAECGELLANIYREKVKPHDTTRSRGKENLRSYLKEGLPLVCLCMTILNYAEFCNIRETEEQYRKGIGNLFGRQTPEFEQFWPGLYVRPQPQQRRRTGSFQKAE